MIEPTVLPAAAESQEANDSGIAVGRRLAICLFLHILAVSVVSQVYPKVILEHFDDNDGQASRFNGWVTFVTSLVQLIAIPALSGASDIVGRRFVLTASLTLHGAAVLGLFINVNSIVWCAACQVVVGLCDVILPVSQAIIVDLSRANDAERSEVTRGFGLIGAAFGLAICVGPVLGGSLVQSHRRTVCIISVSLSGLAVVSTRLYGWKETAPGLLRLHQVPGSSSRGNESMKCSSWFVVNPFSVLKVFLVDRLLVQLALCLFLFCMSLNVYLVWYNYFDFHFHWSARDISYFFSAFGLTVAATSGLGISFLVPQRLSEEQGFLLGLLLQGIAAVLYGSVPYGWMMYLVIILTSLQFLTEPCIQSIMARLVGADRQGSLQGAVMSLRVLAQGVAGPAYGQIFSFGVSGSIKKALGMLVPGLPLFVAAAFSLAAYSVACCSLKRQPCKTRKATGEAQVSGGVRSAPNGSNANDLPAPPYGMEYGDDDVTNAEMLINESGDSAGILSDNQDTVRQPLLARSFGGSDGT